MDRKLEMTSCRFSETDRQANIQTDIHRKRLTNRTMDNKTDTHTYMYSQIMYTDTEVQKQRLKATV